MEEGAGKAEEVEEAAREYEKMTKHLLEFEIYIAL